MFLWWVLLVTIGVLAFFLARRRARRADVDRRRRTEWGDGSHDVGERWRTGGFGDSGGGP